MRFGPGTPERGPNRVFTETTAATPPKFWLFYPLESSGLMKKWPVFRRKSVFTRQPIGVHGAGGTKLPFWCNSLRWSTPTGPKASLRAGWIKSIQKKRCKLVQLSYLCGIYSFKVYCNSFSWTRGANWIKLLQMNEHWPWTIFIVSWYQSSDLFCTKCTRIMYGPLDRKVKSKYQIYRGFEANLYI